VGVDEFRVGHGIGLRVTRIHLEPENHHPQAHADLRCSEPRAIEIAHGVPHIGQQRLEFGSTEPADRFSDRQQARIAHSENFAYCHGS